MFIAQPGAPKQSTHGGSLAPYACLYQGQNCDSVHDMISERFHIQVSMKASFRMSFDDALLLSYDLRHNG